MTGGEQTQSRNYGGLPWSSSVGVKCVIFGHCLPRHTHLYMQLYGVYGILETKIYGSDRSGTIYGVGVSLYFLISATNCDSRTSRGDISWGHLVGTSRADISCGHFVGTSRGRLDVGVARRSHGVVLQLHRRSRWVAIALGVGVARRSHMGYSDNCTDALGGLP
jgi:hypothetical protein